MSRTGGYISVEEGTRGWQVVMQGPYHKQTSPVIGSREAAIDYARKLKASQEKRESVLTNHAEPYRIIIETDEDAVEVVDDAELELTVLGETETIFDGPEELIEALEVGGQQDGPTDDADDAHDELPSSSDLSGFVSDSEMPQVEDHENDVTESSDVETSEDGSPQEVSFDNSNNELISDSDASEVDTGALVEPEPEPEPEPEVEKDYIEHDDISIDDVYAEDGKIHIYLTNHTLRESVIWREVDGKSGTRKLKPGKQQHWTYKGTADSEVALRLETEDGPALFVN